MSSPVPVMLSLLHLILFAMVELILIVMVVVVMVVVTAEEEVWLLKLSNHPSLFNIRKPCRKILSMVVAVVLAVLSFVAVVVVLAVEVFFPDRHVLWPDLITSAVSTVTTPDWMHPMVHRLPIRSRTDFLWLLLTFFEQIHQRHILHMDLIEEVSRSWLIYGLDLLWLVSGENDERLEIGNVFLIEGSSRKRGDVISR